MSTLGAVRRTVRPYLRPISQWAVVALPGRQNIVTVEFDGAGAAWDVTQSHTVAALDPLTIAVAGAAPIQRGRMLFRDMGTNRLLGWLQLNRVSEIADIGLFHVENSDHYCVGWPLRPWNRHLQSRAQLASRRPQKFALDPVVLQHLMIAYIRPRPVILVSVEAPGHTNIFPMDLIGPLGPDRFSLALRQTSKSIAAMCATGRVVLSDAPAAFKDDVYRLGEHHKEALVDWSALPFATERTDTFGVPAMAEALRIRELAIEQSHAIGSHRFFLGRFVTERALDDAAQLHHTAGFHAYFRDRRGEALVVA
jgi:flavin reductase (DIM6/NTAB) family NADH-FMN oxidoreductase RutF